MSLPTLLAADFGIDDDLADAFQLHGSTDDEGVSGRTISCSVMRTPTFSEAGGRIRGG